jgi:alpha-ribazole phosphatase
VSNHPSIPGRRRVILARHTPVAEAYRGVCYGGDSDAPLPDAAAGDIGRLVEALLAEGPITHIVHSGLMRCSAPAEALAARAGAPATVDVRLRERGFGAWELRRWTDIHAETGDAMMGMITHPDTWRPPGGETTFALRDRALAWYADLPAEGCIVAITHGGPIAALRGALVGAPVDQWPTLIPACGEIVRLP